MHPLVEYSTNPRFVSGIASAQPSRPKSYLRPSHISPQTWDKCLTCCRSAHSVMPCPYQAFGVYTRVCKGLGERPSSQVKITDWSAQRLRARDARLQQDSYIHTRQHHLNFERVNSEQHKLNRLPCFAQELILCNVIRRTKHTNIGVLVQ